MKNHKRDYPDILKFNTLSTDYFCLDIETTSLDPVGEGILEVYWMHMKDGNKVKEGHKLFFHKNYRKTSNIHQIPDADLIGEPEFSLKDANSKEFIDEIKYYINRCCNKNDNMVLISHYAPFEIKWMSNKLGKDLADYNIRVYDTRSSERYIDSEIDSASLIETCKRRGIKSPNGKDFHRAQWDVEAMWEVTVQQFKELKDRFDLDVGDKWRAV